MMSIEQSNYYGLGEVGSRIWSLIEEPQSIDHLVDELQKDFEVDRRVCIDDTLEFLEQLRSAHLVDVFEQ